MQGYPKGRKLFEAGAIVLSVLIVAGISIPSFFGTLKDVRGRECSNRLRLITECLYELAMERNTKPGEQICSLFELNDRMLEKQDRATHAVRIGAEPDCADSGDFEVDLFMCEDGSIPLPKCSLGQEEENIRKHQHTLKGWEPDWQEELRQRAIRLQQRAEEARKAKQQEAEGGLLDISNTMQTKPEEESQNN